MEAKTMFVVRSLVRIKTKYIEITDFTGRFPDKDYIEGAIELSLAGQYLLTRQEWDYIDQLWAYFVDGLYDTTAYRPFTTFLPDQPVKVTFERLHTNNQVHIKVRSDTERQGYVEYVEFMSAMVSAGKQFFSKMANLVPENSSSYYRSLGRLNKLSF